MKNKRIYIIVGIVLVAIVIVVAVVISTRKRNNETPLVSDETINYPNINDILNDMASNPENYPSYNDFPGQTGESPGGTTTPSNGSTTNNNPVSSSNPSQTGAFISKDGTMFEIVTVEDVEEDGIVIKWVKARFSRYLNEGSVRSAAEKIVEQLSVGTKLNGIGMDFYYTENVSFGYNVARAVWAPNGDWTQLSAVSAGDYSKNAYYVIMAPTPEPTPETVAGMSYENAQKAYGEYFGAQDKISDDAFKKYADDPVSRQAYITEQNDKLLNDICKKYGMKVESIGDLILAGLQYGWDY